MESSLTKALLLNFTFFAAALLLCFFKSWLGYVAMMCYFIFTIAMIPVLAVAAIYTGKWNYYKPYLLAELIALAVTAIILFLSKDLLSLAAS